jgi:hypothetical protein
MEHDARILAVLAAEEVAMAVMRDAAADPDVRISAAHVALWLQRAAKRHRQALGAAARYALARRETAA